MRTKVVGGPLALLMAWCALLLWLTIVDKPCVAGALLGNFLHYISTYQCLPTSLRAFLQTLLRWLCKLHNAPPRVARWLGSPSNPLKPLGRVCRWPLIAYAAWLGVTYTTLLVYYHRRDALSTVVCATPYVVPQLVLCQPLGLPTPDLLAGIPQARGGFAGAMKQLLHEADALLTILRNIHANLDHIKTSAISIKGLSSTSTHTVLQDLWVFIVGKETGAEIKGHKKLLGKIPLFYDAASAAVRDIQSSLLQAKAEMKSLASLPHIKGGHSPRSMPPSTRRNHAAEVRGGAGGEHAEVRREEC
ncbi:predicted protein [Chaetomium globosum CBS 148.51]|uniref:Uncharacterized protein n=1 Tax=Chaetomium globosum (strain ATCC 6205 / CBS 148.51 / DSM 1962 / NBRC 6347 / NRRL 1970) TaxID=306901 RepID=Q2GT33_CHAGB|nr:uncharacterized protein CHGG_08871 [Chaetomium globosum CBS 148.51]EAQ84857.1 predicted protein [Chaetomium globosum CBS 148.51]